jgi:hypothetical protein
MPGIHADILIGKKFQKKQSFGFGKIPALQ